MVNVDDAVLARLKTHGQTFEVLVDCDNAISIKEGKDIDMREVLATEQIFTDSRKGDLVPEASMKQAFGTDNNIEVAREIIKKGEIQLTAEHRKSILDQKRKQIMDMIHRNGVDPKTHLPHPMTRLENAFEQAKIKIDEYKDIKIQVQEIMKKLLPILPIKFETKRIQLTIPPEYAAKAQYTLRAFGRLQKEDWQNDGCLVVELVIPGGMEEVLYEKINAVCHGNVSSKALETS